MQPCFAGIDEMASIDDWCLLLVGRNVGLTLNPFTDANSPSYCRRYKLC